jgi:DNA mismatch repair protein MutS
MREAQAQKLLPDLLPQEPVTETVTPLMAQYQAIKAQHADCLVFFRLGDFYELFFDDAVTASRALDIALTRRGQHQGQDIPMCGVPAHSHENYLARLIRKGFRVAICEQTETPDDAKKRAKKDGGKAIVTRDVVRIVTPGTVTEDSLLDTNAANYLACIAGVGDDLAVAWMDLAAGKPAVQTLTYTELGGVLARLDPAEILIPQKLIEVPELFETLAQWRNRFVPQPNGRFDSDNAARRLQALYSVTTLAGFGDLTRADIAALGALLDYVELTQKHDLKHLARPERWQGEHVAIDAATRRNLELTRTLAGERRGSLLSVIDRTMTGAGARLLVARLVAPLTDAAAIGRRLDAVGAMVAAPSLRKTLREQLKHIPDLERALARLALGRGGPRDLASVRDALLGAEQIRLALLAAGSLPQELAAATQSLGQHNTLIDLLQRALTADLPMLARDGNFIARGYAPPLDDLLLLRDDSRRLIAVMQQKYADHAAVPTLKIKHNNVISYYIEVTPQHADRLLAQKELFIHRQTLAGAARFTTVELSDLARKIDEAADKALAIELQLFADLVGEIVQHLPDLRSVAVALAEIDTVSAIAELAVEQNYTRPVVDDTLSFHIVGGRHPVVEQSLPTGVSFIANDCDLSPHQKLWLLTGPNMAGKSTFLRQNALIALLAQMGSFVPAKSAHIGVVDRLFSRVGASDDLARGHSTFMVEMVETAAILHQAGQRSLVILDEIGRGTATYDGLSIAWAVIEQLHNTNQCRALFATHYHELTALTTSLPSLSCHTMRIKEWQNEIIFLHQVDAGVADRSYGIHVAKMAGLPPDAIARAEDVLASLENSEKRSAPIIHAPRLDKTSAKTQAVVLPQLAKVLADLSPDELSPKQALEAIYEIKRLHSSGL